jgi:hypothetical protein
MKSQRLIASILLWLLVGLVPATANALEVTLQWFDANGTFIGSQSLTGAATVNLDSDAPVGGPRAYGPFTISKCSGCSGRARVFVSDSDIDRLILTDAQITNTSTTANFILKISVDSGELTVSGPSGQYPYAVELNGSFTAPLGQSAINPPGNQIRVATFACHGWNGEGYNSCTRIDSPELDPGEVAQDGGFCTNPCTSVVAPPYLAGGLPTYAPKENQNVFCAGAEGKVEESLCLPALKMQVEMTLRPRNGARLPGSIGSFHVGDRCEPDANPPLLVGCEKMSDLFASLGPKGFKVYEVRMETSPGSDRSIDVRLAAANSPDAWRTHRGDHNDGNPNQGNNTSSTKVTLESNGTGEVRAKGLCPVSGCLPAGTVLPVRLFCGQEIRYTTGLRLDGKGDGRADVIFSVPCSDPAVLIMDPTHDYWVAAPVIL